MTSLDFNYIYIICFLTLRSQQLQSLQWHIQYSALVLEAKLLWVYWAAFHLRWQKAHISQEWKKYKLKSTFTQKKKLEKMHYGSAVYNLQLNSLKQASNSHWNKTQLISKWKQCTSPTFKFWGSIITTCYKSLPVRRLFPELQATVKATHCKHPNNVDKLQNKMFP